MATQTDVLPAVRRSNHDKVALAMRELDRLRLETEALVAELRRAPAKQER